MADETATPAPLSREDLVAGLIEPDSTPETPTDTPAETVTKPETPAETPAKLEREGTPDKALQKLQQDMSAAQRKLDKLVDKLDSGETLSASEKKEVAAAQRKIDAVRNAMKTGNEFDIVNEADNLAHSVVEVDDRVGTLEERLKQAEKALAERSQADSWAKHRSDYQGVDVDAVWQKACADAAETIGTDSPEKTRLLASRFFHERCQAASKSIAGKSKTPAGKTPATGSGRVSSDTSRPSAVTSTEESVYRKNALALVQDDD